uniref:Nuclear receptor corepressor 2-like n=1 Tax=Camelus bactrianus TaxID=9837 RepID=A0A9W3FKY5_CAMBA|nr:nuclear receptor corepressor 2-like [Camelus bactrianus]
MRQIAHDKGPREGGSLANDSPRDGYHGGSYSPDGVEPVSPVSSPSLTHDKGLPKHLEELDKSHLEGDLRHKQPGGVLPCAPTHHSPVKQGQLSPHGTGPGKLGGEAAHLPHLRPLPESQPSSSPLLQTTPGVKGHQRVVTLAQHISEVITQDYTRHHPQQLSAPLPAPLYSFPGASCPVLDLRRPPSDLYLPPPDHGAPARGSPHSEGGKRSPEPSKTSALGSGEDGIEPVSPPEGMAEPGHPRSAMYPLLYRDGEQAEPSRMGSKSPGNPSQPPAFFSKLTESNSAMVKSKKLTHGPAHLLTSSRTGPSAHAQGALGRVFLLSVLAAQSAAPRTVPGTQWSVLSPIPGTRDGVTPIQGPHGSPVHGACHVWDFSPLFM